MEDILEVVIPSSFKNWNVYHLQATYLHTKNTFLKELIQIELNKRNN